MRPVWTSSAASRHRVPWRMYSKERLASSPGRRSRSSGKQRSRAWMEVISSKHQTGPSEGAEVEIDDVPQLGVELGIGLPLPVLTTMGLEVGPLGDALNAAATGAGHPSPAHQALA